MSDIEIITFGCRLNAYESEVMRKHASDAGLGATVIVNTCAVTQESVRQARQAIRRARRENPQAKIVVTGCAAQIDPAPFAAMDEVDHIIGNQEKTEARTFLGLGCGDTERVKVNDIMSVKETAGHLIEGFGAQARAYVQIQNGCDHRCTFCIIPYGRGPSRSVPAGEVVAQVRKLVENGYAEIVLTGVDITAYGADLPGEITLGKLTSKILALVPELKRLQALLNRFDRGRCRAAQGHRRGGAADAASAPLAPGRRRPYAQAHEAASLAGARGRLLRGGTQASPDMVFGADLIAGFPTESDAMFQSSLSLVDDCGLTFLHVFPFSARPGTPAARMRQINGAVIASRAASLREKGVQALQRHLVNAKGRHIQVLMESEGRGRAGDFTPVKIEAAEGTPKVLDAVVSGHDGSALIARTLV